MLFLQRPSYPRFFGWKSQQQLSISRIAAPPDLSKARHHMRHGLGANKTSHLRILRTPTYIHILKEKRVKLDSHSHVGQLVGYCGTANQYRVWDYIRKDVVVARDVVFDESLPAS